MENIFIKVDEIPRNLVDEYFRDKDIVSIDDLIATLDDVDWKLKDLQDDFENFKEEVNDNYKFVGQAEQIGYNENW